MSLLLETIKVRNKRLYHISAHTARMNHSRRVLFNCRDDINLAGRLAVPSTIGAGLYKCRVVYDTEIRQIEFLPYEQRTCTSLRLVRDDTICYDHKYADRSRFDALLRHAQADDIVIVKNGFLTDASYANILVSDGKNWFTPRKPLLHGIRRQLLLDGGLIREADIRPAELNHFISIALINVLRPMDDRLVLPCSSILPAL
jgi:4-amino-4-deoxychorismate lyase